MQLQGDPQLFKRPQTVIATENGTVVGRNTIPVLAPAVMTVPLKPTPNGRCLVRFTGGRTLVPATVEPSSTDTRPLGAHFQNFTYNP